MSMQEAARHIRAPAIRWHLLQIADVARPQGISTDAMLPVIRSVYPDASDTEVRRELGYLEDRELVKITKDPLDNWCVALTRCGVDVVEYTVDVLPGIARPQYIRKG